MRKFVKTILLVSLFLAGFAVEGVFYWPISLMWASYFVIKRGVVASYWMVLLMGLARDLAIGRRAGETALVLGVTLLGFMLLQRWFSLDGRRRLVLGAVLVGVAFWSDKTFPIEFIVIAPLAGFMLIKLI